MGAGISLGTIEDVSRWYSYPNNFNEVGFMAQSLHETLKIYLMSTFARDAANVNITAIADIGDNVVVELDGPDADAYVELLQTFVKCAHGALQTSIEIRISKQWQWNWRFFMPLGLAMKNHPTVQLLHFPPDYSLEEAQDYLSSSTTKRWGDLLAVNGADPEGTDIYQTTIDVVPVAAPSNAGGELSGLPKTYSEYSINMINFLTSRSDGLRKPMVLFGSPVRSWIEQVTGVYLRVGEARMLEIAGMQVPVYAANHPSYFWNVVAPDCNHPLTDEQRHADGMVTMQQDLVAACWQFMMAKTPGRDPLEAAKTASSIWSDREHQQKICELTWVQGFDMKPQDAQQRCSVMPKADVEAVEARLESIRKRIGPMDGREPDKIPRPDGTFPRPGSTTL